MARLLTLALSLVLTIGLFAPLGQAAPVAASPLAVPPTAREAAGARTAPSGELPPPGVEKVLKSDDPAAVPAAHNGNLTSADNRPRNDFAPWSAPQPAAKSSGPGAAAGDGSAEAVACNPTDFGRTGAELIRLIKSVSVDCIDSLFRIEPRYAAAAFRGSQMLTVAAAVHEAAVAYQGNNSGSVQQLMYYYQAGYAVQWAYPSVVGEYSKEVPKAILPGVTAFFANSHALDTTAENAGPLAKAAILADVTREPVTYLPIAKLLLTAYNSSAWDKDNLMWGLNPAFLVLFRGIESRDPKFREELQADPALIDLVAAFANRALVHAGGTYDPVLTNSIKELSRFMYYPEFLPRVQPYLKALSAKFSVTGPTRNQRAAAAVGVRAYDQANCAYYGTCQDAELFQAAYLTNVKQCSPSIRILAEAMTPDQLDSTCTSLNGQDAYFHAVARDNGPVADDRNSTIDVVVFDRYEEYDLLSPVMFGNSTSNGGMYLEGDPAKAGNKARFVAYEKTWGEPGFSIWNLNHEYTHYLDARFNMYGDFLAADAFFVAWWTEGLAEVVADSYLKVVNTKAIEAAAQHTYRLSDLFDNYYQNEDRTYRWGYLAVRYMLERHRPDVDSLLALYRKGDWAGSRTLLKTTIGTRYDADFDSWLNACAAGECKNTPSFPRLSECAGGDLRKLDSNCVRSNLSATTGNYAHFYLWVPAGTRQIRVTSSGGTGNGELYYNPYGWAYTNSYVTRSAGPDNSESLTVTNPQAGYVFFSLYAQQGFSGVSVTSEL
ncbi:collagenase [Kitasatospora purpeofusca]|uniref:M9 family metallopeptidase n=1 Tax=Kitasatospora purpeofusca TaxID=67352 RepID=UPI002E1096C5|nr:collagenase [Kitasatospora purpeofusca]WSR44922.1 collagenase [Kitasatospora purpeofusca]